MRGAVPPRLRLASVQWLAACAVVLEALLARYGPGTGWLLDAGVFAVAGFVLRTSPVAFGGSRARWREALAGAAALAVLGLALRGGAALALGLGSRSLWLPPWVVLAVVLLVDRGTWRRLARLFGVEWLKMRRSLLFQVGLGAAALVTLFAALTHEKLPGASGWTLASASLGTGQWAAEVFLLVLGATAIAGEATGGTLKMILPHAYRRSDWVLAKTLVLLVVAVCFSVVVVGVSVGHAWLAEGLGDVTRELEPLFGEETGTLETFETAGVMRGHLADTVLAGLAALVATALLGLLLSSVFDGVVAALCASFLLFAGFKFADVVLNLSRETLHGIYTWFPAEMRDVLGKLGRALNERWDEALFGQGLGLSLLAASGALLLAVAIFSGRDLQA